MVADEVTLMGNRSVEVAAGARVASTSANRGTIDPSSLDAVTLQLNGTDAGAAVVSVSDRNLYSMLREDGDLDRGVVDTADGARACNRRCVVGRRAGSRKPRWRHSSDWRSWQLGAGSIYFDNAVHVDGLSIDSGLPARCNRPAR